MTDEGLEPNARTYNILIQAAGRAGDLALAERTYRELLRAGLEPTERTYSILFTAAARARRGGAPAPAGGAPLRRSGPFGVARSHPTQTEWAFRLHGEMTRGFGVRSNAAVVTSLVSLCGACGEPDEAVRVATEHIAAERGASPALRAGGSRGWADALAGRPLDPYIRSALFSVVVANNRRDLAARVLEWHHASVDACALGERAPAGRGGDS